MLRFHIYSNFMGYYHRLGCFMHIYIAPEHTQISHSIRIASLHIGGINYEVFFVQGITSNIDYIGIVTNGQKVLKLIGNASEFKMGCSVKPRGGKWFRVHSLFHGCILFLKYCLPKCYRSYNPKLLLKIYWSFQASSLLTRCCQNL